MSIFKRKPKESPDARISAQCASFAEFAEDIAYARNRAGYTSSASFKLACFAYFACFFEEYQLISKPEKYAVFDYQAKTIALGSALTYPDARDLLLHFDHVYDTARKQDIHPADQLRFYVYAVERMPNGRFSDDDAEIDADLLNFTTQAFSIELQKIRDIL